MSARRLTVPLTSLLLAATLFTACGSDDDGADTGDSTESSEEGYEIVSDQAVSDGLEATTAAMTALAAAPETATDEAVLEVFEGWESYEGTIKQNEPESYLALEDAMGVFKKGAESGDAVGMQTGIADFSAAAADYLAAHPAA
jgi:hypothetical protein